MKPAIMALALITDRLVGDPGGPIHPVAVIGRFIAWGERLLNRPGYLPQKLKGLLLVFVTGGLVAVALAVVMKLLPGPLFQLAAEVVLLALAIAPHTLAREAQNIYRSLEQDIYRSRALLSRVVSRSTEDLPPEEIIRGTVETVAENTTDAVIAPLFYYVLGGIYAAWIYRVINTLDAMIGYKNERFREFGWAAARLDDVANFIPARITGLILLAALFISGRNWKGGWKSWRSHAHRHPSPNAGIPESVIAGGLGIRLGGYSVYHGALSFRPYMGQKTRELAAQDILISIRLMKITALLFFGFSTAVWVLARLVLAGGRTLAMG